MLKRLYGFLAILDKGVLLFHCLATLVIEDMYPALPYTDPKLWELWYIPYYG